MARSGAGPPTRSGCTRHCCSASSPPVRPFHGVGGVLQPTIFAVVSNLTFSLRILLQKSIFNFAVRPLHGFGDYVKNEIRRIYNHTVLLVATFAVSDFAAKNIFNPDNNYYQPRTSRRGTVTGGWCVSGRSVGCCAMRVGWGKLYTLETMMALCRDHHHHEVWRSLWRSILIWKSARRLR